MVRRVGACCFARAPELGRPGGEGDRKIRARSAYPSPPRHWENEGRAAQLAATAAPLGYGRERILRSWQQPHAHPYFYVAAESLAAAFALSNPKSIFAPYAVAPPNAHAGREPLSAWICLADGASDGSSKLANQPPHSRAIRATDCKTVSPTHSVAFATTHALALAPPDFAADTPWNNLDRNRLCWISAAHKLRTSDGQRRAKVHNRAEADAGRVPGPV